MCARGGEFFYGESASVRRRERELVVEGTERLCVTNTFVETRERVGGRAINGD